MNRTLPRLLMAPAVVTLFLWMIVPLLMSIYFSAVRYNLMQPGDKDFIGLANFEFFFTDPDFYASVSNTLLLLGSVIAITVVLGIALALLVNEAFPGRGIVRVLLISPFFVMPTANALLWKHMMMNPVYGVLSQWPSSSASSPWTGSRPPAVQCDRDGGVAVAAVRLPDLHHQPAEPGRDQMEAAGMDGANPFQKFWFLTLPHLGRPIAVVVMIEMIFLMSVFAEIFTTTSGGPGNASTNVAFLIFKQALLNFDVGVASAGALFAVVLANVAAVFLIRMIGKNLD